MPETIRGAVKVSFFDLSGRIAKVCETTPTDSLLHLPIHDLSAGKYMLLLQTAQGWAVKSVVVE